MTFGQKLDKMLSLKRRADYTQVLKDRVIEDFYAKRTANQDVDYGTECKLNMSEMRKILFKFDNDRKQLLDEAWQVEKRLLADYKLDSQTMCKLLQNITGKQWKPMQIGGYHIEDSEDYMNEKYINNSYFGVALVSEDYPQFNYRFLLGNQIDTKSSSLILGQREAEKISAVNYEVKQDVLNNFNWLHHYLYVRNLLHQLSDYDKDGSQFRDTTSIWKRKIGNCVYYTDLKYSRDKVETLDSVNYNKDLIIQATELFLADVRKSEKQIEEEPFAE